VTTSTSFGDLYTLEEAPVEPLKSLHQTHRVERCAITEEAIEDRASLGGVAEAQDVVGQGDAIR
jgi:hypothetical protein